MLRYYTVGHRSAFCGRMMKVLRLFAAQHLHDNVAKCSDWHQGSRRPPELSFSIGSEHGCSSIERALVPHPTGDACQRLHPGVPQVFEIHPGQCIVVPRHGPGRNHMTVPCNCNRCMVPGNMHDMLPRHGPGRRHKTAADN